MPSGHVPANVFDDPAQFVGVGCKVAVPPEAVQEMRAMVVEETGPRECWVTPEFKGIADDAYAQIGSPTLTFDNAWEVFAAMSAVIHALG